MFDRTGTVIVSQMSNNNPWGHSAWNTDGYQDGDTIYLNKIDATTLAHEIAHFNYYIEYEEGVSYRNQPCEIMVRGEEAEYAGSRPAAIYPRTLEAEREREEKQKQEDESKERQKEEARQREIDESYARMQRDRTDIFNTGGGQTKHRIVY